MSKKIILSSESKFYAEHRKIRRTGKTGNQTLMDKDINIVSHVTLVSEVQQIHRS